MHVQNAINSLTVPSSKTSAHRPPNLDDTNLGYFEQNTFEGYRNASQPRKERKNAPIPEFPSHNTNIFMHTAVLLPLLFAFSPYRDNVHPCPRASILCIYPIPLMLYIIPRCVRLIQRAQSSQVVYSDSPLRPIYSPLSFCGMYGKDPYHLRGPGSVRS